MSQGYMTKGVIYDDSTPAKNRKRAKKKATRRPSHPNFSADSMIATQGLGKVPSSS